MKKRIISKQFIACILSTTMITGLFAGIGNVPTNAEVTNALIPTTNPTETTSTTPGAITDWYSYFGANSGWYEGSRGQLTQASDNSWTALVDSIGWGGVYGAQVKKSVTAYANNTYELSFSLLSSDIDKWVFIKIDDYEYNMVYGKWIQLTAGVEKEVSFEFTPSSNVSEINFCFGGEFGDRTDEADLYSLIDFKPNDGDANYATTIKCNNFSLVNIRDNSDTETTTKKESVTTTVAPATTTVAPTTTAVNKVTKPAKVKIKKIKRKAKSATINIKKIKTAKGYQVKYGTNKKITKNVTTKTVKKTTFTIKKLKTSKKYYIKARAYVQDGKKKVYGKWSTVKTIKKFN